MVLFYVILKRGYAKSKSQIISSEKSNESKFIKCIISKKSNFWPEKSKKSKFYQTKSEKSNFGRKHKLKKLKCSDESQKVNCVGDDKADVKRDKRNQF